MPPLYPMAHQFYRELNDDLGSLVVSREANRRLELRGGGFIDFWSLENGGDRIRGQKYHRIVPDEAAVTIGLKRIWERVLRPTLTDYRGDAWFLSTPRRGSDFETLYKLGMSGDPDWASFKVPTAITRDGTAGTEVIGTNNPWLAKNEDGTPNIEAAIAELEKARLGSSPSAFAEEYLADFEASESDLVFPEFSIETHVRTSPVSWSECKWRVVGIDPGGGDPTAVVPLGVSQSEQIHQYGEFYKQGDVAVDDVISYVAKLNSLAPLDMVVVDPSAKGWVEQLQRYGFPAYPANNARGAGLESVRFMLGNGRLTISPDAQRSIAEFRSYRWAKRRDADTGERYATSTAEDHHADAMDARRYALMAILNGLPNHTTQKQPLKFRPMQSSRFGS